MRAVRETNLFFILALSILGMILTLSQGADFLLFLLRAASLGDSLFPSDPGLALSMLELGVTPPDPGDPEFCDGSS